MRKSKSKSDFLSPTRHTIKEKNGIYSFLDQIWPKNTKLDDESVHLWAAGTHQATGCDFLLLLLSFGNLDTIITAVTDIFDLDEAKWTKAIVTVEHRTARETLVYPIFIGEVIATSNTRQPGDLT